MYIWIDTKFKSQSKYTINTTAMAAKFEMESYTNRSLNKMALKSLYNDNHCANNGMIWTPTLTWHALWQYLPAIVTEIDFITKHDIYLKTYEEIEGVIETLFDISSTLKPKAVENCEHVRLNWHFNHIDSYFHVQNDHISIK